MAYFYTLCIECGSNRDAAKSVQEHFADLSLVLANSLATRCECWLHQDVEGNWWALVHPTGFNHGLRDESRPELLGAVNTSEIGFLLYAHLRTSPAFRYAVAGWETEDFRYYSELSASDLDLVPGLVVSDELLAHLHVAHPLERFAAGYWWKPYEGEKDNP